MTITNCDFCGKKAEVKRTHYGSGFGYVRLICSDCIKELNAETIQSKTFKVKVQAKFPRIEKDREIPEILKKSLRTLEIDAESEVEAIEKVKQEMLKTTYKQFFPELNDRTDSIWFESFSIQHLFPENYIFEDGEKFLSDWEEKDIIKMSEEKMTPDIFERVEIKVELKQEKTL